MTRRKLGEAVLLATLSDRFVIHLFLPIALLARSILTHQYPMMIQYCSGPGCWADIFIWQLHRITDAEQFNSSVRRFHPVFYKYLLLKISTNLGIQFVKWRLLFLLHFGQLIRVNNNTFFFVFFWGEPSFSSTRLMCGWTSIFS